MSGKLKFGFLNTFRRLTVIIEPWCDEVSLAVGSYLDLHIEYPKLDLLETGLAEGYFTIYVWGGCRARLYIDRVEVTPPSLRKPL